MSILFCDNAVVMLCLKIHLVNIWKYWLFWLKIPSFVVEAAQMSKIIDFVAANIAGDVAVSRQKYLGFIVTNATGKLSP